MDPSDIDELAYLPNEDISEEYSMTEAVHLLSEGRILLFLHITSIIFALEESFNEDVETDWVCEFFGHNGKTSTI